MAITRANVTALIDLDAGDDASVWIGYANIITGEFIVGFSGLSQARQDMISALLAAHFAAMKYERGTITREMQGSSDQSYQVATGAVQGLAETRFGRQAIMMDTTGSLQALASKPMSAEFRVV
jgi:hypothetical protein